MSDQIDFRYAPVLDEASLCPASFRCVEGPVNSGKSVWSLSEIYGWACTMPRGKDGLRHSRMLVTRDTMPNLESSTLNTWLQWFPEDQYGKITGSDYYTQKWNFEDVRATVVFRAFGFDDLEKQIAKLRSTEWTAAWVNEGQFFPLALVKEIYSRTGRFPARKDCPAYDRSKRTVMDMNAPASEENWTYYMRGKTPLPREMTAEQRFVYQKPDDWEFFEQPPAVIEVRSETGEFEKFDVNPKAENLPHIGEDSIRQELSGRTYNEVRRDLMNKVVPMQRGYPRYTQFDVRLHVRDELTIFEELPVIAGYDPGLNGCVTLWQQPDDRWLCHHVIKADGRGANALADDVIKTLNLRFPFWKDFGFVGWGDPYGKARFGGSSTGEIKQEDTAFAIMDAKGLKFRPPEKKDNPSLRHEIGKSLMLSLSDTGGPRLLLDKRYCKPLISALDGGCTMKQEKTPDGLKTIEKVDKKNPHADVCEAAEYAWWGGGEGVLLVKKPDHARRARKTNAVGKASIWQSKTRKKKLFRR